MNTESSLLRSSSLKVRRRHSEDGGENDIAICPKKRQPSSSSIAQLINKPLPQIPAGPPLERANRSPTTERFQQINAKSAGVFSSHSPPEKMRDPLSNVQSFNGVASCLAVAGSKEKRDPDEVKKSLNTQAHMEAVDELTVSFNVQLARTPSVNHGKGSRLRQVVKKMARSSSETQTLSDRLGSSRRLSKSPAFSASHTTGFQVSNSLLQSSGKQLSKPSRTAISAKLLQPTGAFEHRANFIPAATSIELPPPVRPSTLMDPIEGPSIAPSLSPHDPPSSPSPVWPLRENPLPETFGIEVKRPLKTLPAPRVLTDVIPIDQERHVEASRKSDLREHLELLRSCGCRKQEGKASDHETHVQGQRECEPGCLACEFERTIEAIFNDNSEACEGAF